MILFKVILNQYFWLTLLLVLAFWVRLYRIDSPIADWHSWRQADTAAVTRNFIKLGFNPLFPRFDDMTGISENPIANPNTYRFVEFPFYNMAVYPFYLIFGVRDMLHRLVSVFFSLGSIVFLYLICRRYLGITVSLLSAAIFALLPFSVFFSRTTLPEPTFLFFSLGMLYFLDKWIWESRVIFRRKIVPRFIWGFWGYLFMAIAFLMKPWAIFFYLPLLYSVIVKKGRIWPLPFKFLAFSVLAVIPFLIWRLWMLQNPEGIPASNWLLNGDGIRARPAFWWWIFSQRLGGEILGVSGAFLFFLGLLIRPKGGNYFFHVWVVSILLYFFIFATGNVRHNYYQYISTPILSVFAALGFVSLIRGSSNFLPRIWTLPFAVVILALTFYFTWIPVKELYKINNPGIYEAGKFADQILPKEAIVVAPYNGDTAFLYQTNRAGFPTTVLPLIEMVGDYGVTHYVSVNRDDKTNWVLRHFKILEDNPKFVIADLTNIEKPLSPEDPEP